MAWSSIVGDSRLHSDRTECGGGTASPRPTQNMSRACRIVKGESVPQIGRDPRGNVDASLTRQLMVVSPSRLGMNQRGTRGRRFFGRNAKDCGLVDCLFIMASLERGAGDRRKTCRLHSNRRVETK